MNNLVIIGISDTADRIIRYINRYHLFNVIGCAVDKAYLPENEYVKIGWAATGFGIWNICTNIWM